MILARLDRWRDIDLISEFEMWMRIREKHRIYKLGALPVFYLVFSKRQQWLDPSW